MFYTKIYEAVGRTPMLKLSGLKEKGEADIYAKLESRNPSGSIKDRAALYMIEDGERQGLLKDGGTIVEPTSGNTGIGLAMIGVSKGYRVILTMPESMSVERQKLIRAYGAEILLTPAKDGMQGSVDLAEKLRDERGYYLPDQFSNPANKMAHYEGTSLEILEELDGELDAFVAGVGTGGTISGIGERLREEVEGLEIVAVEPEASQLLGGGQAGPHKIQGIGANFIPSLLNREILDRVMPISNQEAYKYARLLSKKEGILVGISSGANLAAAKKLAAELGEGKKVVTVFPDGGERYLSTDLFSGEKDD